MSLSVTIGGVSYPTEQITACRTYGAFFDGNFNVGTAVSRQIDLTIRNPGEIPSGAEIKLSESGLPQGTFYIATRPENYNNLLTIHGYDSMLKTNAAWLTEDYENVVFPVSEDDAVNDICARIGVERAPGLTLRNEFPIDYPVGEYGDLTMQEVLCGIAGANAGCFFINLDGKMDLWRPNTKRQEFDIGKKMTNFEASPVSKPVTMAYVNPGGGGTYRSGSYSGLSVNFYCPWGSHEMAESVRVQLSGFNYRGFTSSDSICDLTADIGDTITANGITSVIISRDVNYYGLNLMQLSAPINDELEDEYPYTSPVQIQQERELAISTSRITRTAEEVRIEISSVEESIAGTNSELESVKEKQENLEQTTQGISDSVNDIQENGVSQVTTTTGYSFNQDGLKISKSGEEMENKLDNTGMYVTRSGESILTANNQGVEALNLTAKQYLVAGSHARFEDYENDRTACFWLD